MTHLEYSVWDGDDTGFLDAALDFYPSYPVRAILDCTVNEGRFWAGSRFRHLVTGMDIDPRYAPDILDDNRVMSKVGDCSFDVVVYDPPHVPNQGRDKKKDFRTRFGLGEKAGKEDGYTFSHTHPLVARQAARVLRPEGLLLAKVADYIHNHRYQWVLIDLVQTIRSAGMTPCDLVIKVRKGPIMDPKWKTRHHVRRCHAYWVVARNSARCEARRAMNRLAS